MKISVISFNYNNNLSTVQQRKTSQNVVSDTFVKSKKNVSFSGERRWKDSFDPLNAPDYKLDEYARIFHTMNVENIILEKYQVGFLTSNTAEKQRISRNRLLPRVEKVRKEKKALLERANSLTQKALLGESNIAEEKVKLSQDFISTLKIIPNDNSITPHRGIIIYGKADSNDKNSFINWLEKEAASCGSAYVKIAYDDKNPQKSFDLIQNAKNNAKRYNKLTGSHTIVQIDNIDKLLTDLNNDNTFDYINEFKNEIENIDSSHATVLFKTDLPLEDFDSAAIASHRFPKKINLKAGITQEEKGELKGIKAKLDALEQDTKRASDYYDLRYDNYDNDDDHDQQLFDEICFRNGYPF